VQFLRPRKYRCFEVFADDTVPGWALGTRFIQQDAEPIVPVAAAF